MRDNVTLPIGSLSLINKIQSDYSLVSGIFGNAGGRSHNFLGIAKLLISNRIDNTVSVHQILPMS